MVCASCGSESKGQFCPGCGQAMPTEPTVAAPADSVALPDSENVTALASAGGATAVATAMRETAREGRASISGAARLCAVAWRSRSEFQQLGIAAAVAAVFACIVGGAISASSDNGEVSASGFSSSQAEPVEAMSDHEICTLQVMAILANEHDNEANIFETNVNGANDPFLGSAQNVQNVFWSAINMDKVGNDAAYEKAVQAARVECGSRLGDAVRPNYPKDGTYPGQ